MRFPEKIFVYEFITGGGVAGEPLPDPLLTEGDVMLRSLLQDLGKIPGLSLLTLRDTRLGGLPGALLCLPVDSADSAEQGWLRAMDWADAVWPIAPETDGVLYALSTRIQDSDRVLLGSRPEAVAIAASKLETSYALENAGVPVVATRPLVEGLPPASGGWVIKPDDGAGSEEIHYVSPAETLAARVLPGGYDWVLQPYVEGTSLSLSVLYDGQSARVLSCNEQHIENGNGRLRLVHVETQSGHWRTEDFSGLAGRVCAVIPGLRGYVGIDLQMTAQGPVVIEVNPRLTTAYAGLSEHLGMNVAELILSAGGWEH